MRPLSPANSAQPSSAMDYQTPPEHSLPLCSPIRRQLLGEVKTPMGVYLPTEEDVPLRAWWQEQQTE